MAASKYALSRQNYRERFVTEDHTFANQKKQQAIKSYTKQLRRERRKGNFSDNPNKIPLGNNLNTTFGRLKLKQTEKQRAEAAKLQLEEKRKAVERKAETLKKRKEERLERLKMLNQKTKKGQPFMKHRMALLLQKIEKQVTKE